MNKHSSFIFFAVLGLALCLSACIPQSNDVEVLPGDDVHNGSEEPGLTAAEKYLEETPDEQIFSDFMKATYILTSSQTEFSSPAEISTDNLLHFFALTAGGEIINACYDEQEEFYRIPVSAVTQVLDTYMNDYQFDPSAANYADYDVETDTMDVYVMDFCIGKSDPALYSAEAVDGDTVRVELSERYSNNIVVTGKITDSGVKFLSCVQTGHSASEASDLTAAGQYLTETSNEEIFDYFIKATDFLSEFSSPADISTDNLFRFFTLVADDEVIDACYDKQEERYRIPVSTVIQVLDAYMEGYQFELSELGYADYDAETEMLENPALGFGSGKTYPALYRAGAVDDDTVRVEISDRYSTNVVIIGKVVDGNIKFLSCTRTDYSIRDLI